MSLLSRAGLLKRIRRGRTDRAKLVASNLDKGIAFQIRSTRELRDLTQGELAAKAGMSQNNLSRLENSDYGKHTLSSLKRVAEALDVALVVRFVPFSRYINWLSGTPQLDEGLSAEALAVPGFDEEERSGRYAIKMQHLESTLGKPIDIMANSVETSLLFFPSNQTGTVGFTAPAFHSGEPVPSGLIIPIEIASFERKSA